MLESIFTFDQTDSFIVSVKLTYRQPAQNGVLTDQLCRAIYAPFRKISYSAQCGRLALILWRLVKGSFFCVF